MLAATLTQDLAPILVAALLVLPLASHSGLGRGLGWAGVVMLATYMRYRTRTELARNAAPPDVALPQLRRSVFLAALGWALAPLLFAPVVPLELLAMLGMVYAGLVAAAMTTLVGDPRSFFLFAGPVLASLGFAFFVRGLSGIAALGGAVVVAYFGAVTTIYRIAHRQLLELFETARQLAVTEGRAARHHHHLQALFSQAPTAIAAVHDSGRVYEVNPEFEKLFGYSQQEAVGRLLNDLIVPPGEREAAVELDRELADSHVLVAEVLRCRKDGSRVWCQASAATCQSSEGLGFVMYDDISDIKRTQTELAEKEAQYRLLVENSSDLVWQVDVEGRITFINAASLQTHGLEPAEMTGRVACEFSDAAHLETDRTHFALLARGEMLRNCETVHRRSDSETVHLAINARPLFDSSGTFAGAAGTARDITATVATREALERARADAERLGQAKTAFLANMSHEIRTPMNGILGMTELLLETDLNPDQRRSADLVRSSATALLTVINDVLDFSKLESGQMQIEDEPFDLHGLVDSVIRLLAVRAFDKGIELTYELRPEVPNRVRGDAGRVRQILNNLLGNAIKFTHDGEVALVVTTFVAPGSGPRLRFSVRDTGIGIEAANLQSIFEEFRQVDLTTTRMYGGTGLGLAIARRFVEGMGGNLEVRSDVGLGSEFSFSIPLKAEPTTEDRGTEQDRVRLQGLRALVVDDNATNRRIVREMLSAVGVSIAEVDGAAAAISAMRGAVDRSEPYQIVIIDGYMPDRDGFQLAADVRSNEELRTTRLLMLTSGGVPGDGRRCRELGISGYLTKPVSRLELLETMTEVLRTDVDSARPEPLVTRHSIAESRQQLRVLLAEDNPVNREVASQMLLRRGHRVDAVENGRLAVEAVRAREYDVVLMDVQMPEMDGLAATREIRNGLGLHELPIVAVTAHALQEERDRCRAAGMNAHLSKPFKPFELFAIVEGWGAEVGTPRTESSEDAPIDLVSFRLGMAEAGVEDAVDEMLQLFIGSAGATLNSLTAACERGNPGEIQAFAHAMKSAAGTVHANGLAELLRQLEMAGRQGDIKRAGELLPRVLETSNGVIEYIGRATTQPAR